MSLYDDLRVDLPEGRLGDVEIRRFTVEPNSLGNLMYALEGRGCEPGEYTRLDRKGALWMSDTTAERRDHAGVAHEIRRRGGRVLIAGLGLGMIVGYALAQPNVEHVDVVEIDPDVAGLVGPHYAGERCTIHVADIFEIRWPRGAHWDVAWFDVWADLCGDNLDDMARLARSYGRRADWKGYWGKGILLQRRRAERRFDW